MVRCIDCGFLELPPFQRPGGGIYGVCTENIKKPKEIQGIQNIIKCRKFVPKRRGWSSQDFQEWKDRHITMRRTFWIAVASVLISISVGIFSVLYPIYSAQSLYEASQRADISILLNPANDQHWTFIVGSGGFLTVNGTLCNEGSRSATIRELELSLIYYLPNDDLYILTKTYANPCKECNWNNSIIKENELRSFSLTVFASSYVYIDPITGETLYIGNSRSDEFGIFVKYYDGEEELFCERRFPAKGLEIVRG